jgi:hypothetical protein
MSRAGFARLDGARVVELDGIAGQHISPREADRAVLQLDSHEHGVTLAEAMVEDLSMRSGIVFQIDRIAVRKIGKTAVFLSDGRRQGYILRVARSPIAAARAARNFAMLERLGQADVPDTIRTRVPEAVIRAEFGG